MSERNRERNYFIVKHDLESFQALPGFIWRTNRGPRKPPHRYKQVHKGDLWIAFAYTSGVANDSLSVVSGFHECTVPAKWGLLPRCVRNADCHWVKPGHGWTIEGKSFGRQPARPIGVLPIRTILGRKVFNNQAITPIGEDDFDKIYQHALAQKFNTDNIPLIGTEPRCEQELLAIVIANHRKYGIEKVLRVRKAFPDLLVQIGGKTSHLELELYSSRFCLHHHDECVARRRCKEDGIQVSVLCWIHDAPKVEAMVQHVFELRSLIRSGGKVSL